MNQLQKIFSTTVFHNKTKNVSYSDRNNINRVEVEQKHPPKNESFHESMKYVLFVGQCFTLMPVTGIWSDNLNAITFKLRSLRAIASLILIAFLLMEIALSTNQAIDAFNLSTVSSLVFLVVTFCGFVLLFRLGRRWGSFMRFWAAREDCFLNVPYKENGIRLKYKIKMVATIFFVMAAIEHGMYIAAAADFAHRQYSICKIKKISFMHFLYYKERTHVFMVISFNFFTGLIITVLAVTCTFCWNFVDILIVVTSIALTKRFNQLNDRVTDYCKNPSVEIFWIEMREHYVKLIQIQEGIDNEMAYIIMLSCASDLFFLCLQLFNSFNNAPFLINSIYFWYSLGYLALRTFAVFYSSALIYEASKKPLQLLRHFPVKYWNKNVQRFMDMVKSETVVLSANQFFYLTKSMILGMAGTIITYELVLMQEIKQDPEIRSFCNITRFNISSIL